LPENVLEQAEAAAELFGAQRHALLRYFHALGLRTEDCEDVLQETFLALHRHLLLERPRTNLRAWIFQTGHNLALKSRARRHRFWDVLMDRFLDPQPDPEELASMSQRQQRLHRVIRALSPRDRACLGLKAEGFTYREISEIAGISVGSVASSIAKTLEKIERMKARQR
jgi:RNA polymerase sigma-70 factor (ECF subfamily)